MTGHDPRQNAPQTGLPSGSLGADEDDRSGVLHASWLGRLNYLEAWRLREAVTTRILAGQAPHLVLVEHDHVFTFGEGADLGRVVAKGHGSIPAGAVGYRIASARGLGYHGPGQLVGYLLVRLDDAVDIAEYASAVEDGIAAAALQFGVGSQRQAGKTGVWVIMPDYSLLQLASVELSTSRIGPCVSFAVNVATDLAVVRRTGWASDPPPVTSFHEIGVPAPVRAVAFACGEAVAQHLGGTVEWCTVAAARDDEVPADAAVNSAQDMFASS